MRIVIEGIEEGEPKPKRELLEELGVDAERLVEADLIDRRELDELMVPEAAKACCCCCCCGGGGGGDGGDDEAIRGSIIERITGR